MISDSLVSLSQDIGVVFSLRKEGIHETKPAKHDHAVEMYSSFVTSIIQLSGTSSTMQGRCTSFATETEVSDEARPIDLQFETGFVKLKNQAGDIVERTLFPLKQYSRSAAGKTQQEEDIRTPETLKRTLDYICSTLLPLTEDSTFLSDPEKLNQLFVFLDDRMRAIAKDYESQSIHSESHLENMNVVFRIYILRILRCLSTEDGCELFGPFKKLNNERLDAVRGGLLRYYKENTGNPHCEEMLSYFLLRCLGHDAESDSRTWWHDSLIQRRQILHEITTSAALEKISSQSVWVSLHAIHYMETAQWLSLLDMVKTLNPLQVALVETSLSYIRVRALQDLLCGKAHGLNRSRLTGRMSLADASRMLLFRNTDQMEKFVSLFMAAESVIDADDLICGSKDSNELIWEKHGKSKLLLPLHYNAVTSIATFHHKEHALPMSSETLVRGYFSESLEQTLEQCKSFGTLLENSLANVRAITLKALSMNAKVDSPAKPKSADPSNAEQEQKTNLDSIRPSPTTITQEAHETKSDSQSAISEDESEDEVLTPVETESNFSQNNRFWNSRDAIEGIAQKAQPGQDSIVAADAFYAAAPVCPAVMEQKATPPLAQEVILQDHVHSLPKITELSSHTIVDNKFSELEYAKVDQNTQQILSSDLRSTDNESTRIEIEPHNIEEDNIEEESDALTNALRLLDPLWICFAESSYALLWCHRAACLFTGWQWHEMMQHSSDAPPFLEWVISFSCVDVCHDQKACHQPLFSRVLASIGGSATLNRTLSYSNGVLISPLVSSQLDCATEDTYPMLAYNDSTNGATLLVVMPPIYFKEPQEDDLHGGSFRRGAAYQHQGHRVQDEQNKKAFLLQTFATHLLRETMLMVRMGKRVRNVVVLHEKPFETDNSVSESESPQTSTLSELYRVARHVLSHQPELAELYGHSHVINLDFMDLSVDKTLHSPEGVIESFAARVGQIMEQCARRFAVQDQIAES